MTFKIMLTTPFSGEIVEPLYDKPDFIRSSLATLAGFIRPNPAYTIKCVDAKFEQKDFKTLLEELVTFSPDIMGISAYTYEIAAADVLAQNVKKLLPSCLIVIGGSHVSALPEETLRTFKSFDIGTVGESEITFQILCNAILNGSSLANIKGIVYRNNAGAIIVNDPRVKITELDIIPMPAWDMFPPAKEYFIQTSRGCPFNCNFCFNPNGHNIRSRSVQNIIAEIEWLIINKKPRRISFGDEAFAADTAFADALLNEMIARNISAHVNWDIQTHATFLSEDLLVKMKRAGISKIEIGVESGNEAILKNMGKGITKNKIIEVFNLAQRHKLKTGAFFIFGHPMETKKSINETIKFAVKINPTEPIFAIMVPFPGTRIAQYVSEGKYGYVNYDAPWQSYRKQINNSIRLSNISISKLKYYLIKGNLSVFIFNFRFCGLLKFIYQHKSSVISFLKIKKQTSH